MRAEPMVMDDYPTTSSRWLDARPVRQLAQDLRPLGRTRPILWASCLAVMALVLASGCSDVLPDDVLPDDVARETSQQALAGGASGVDGAGADHEERFIVGFVERERGLRAVRGSGGRVVRELPGRAAAAVVMPPDAARALARSPDVAYVEPDARRYLQSTASTEVVPWGIRAVQADPELWALVDATRTVCIIDSGFEVGHEDLADLVEAGLVSGSEDRGAGAWYRDGCGHGTHVAGTIAATANDVGVLGVLPNGLHLHIVRVFNDRCDWTHVSDLVAAVDECRQAGADVINMSLSGAEKSRTEEVAFEAASAAGILLVAAAGNEGSNRRAYPASYPSVVSVAAVDEALRVADFSQQNNAVELAAPGVDVLSTVPFVATAEVSVGGVTYTGRLLEDAGLTGPGGVAGALADGRRCEASGDWAGRIVLCERGGATFSEKVANARSGGAVGVVVYNHEPGTFEGVVTGGSPIPALALSREDGLRLLAEALGAEAVLLATREYPESGYEAWEGTSMAAPHVAGVAALIWSAADNQGLAVTHADVRAALTATALDLGAPGRDNAYGFGLVQAFEAFEHLTRPAVAAPRRGKK
jgi:serine protease